MKKLLIRIIGSLCIFVSVVLMFLPTWIYIDGIDRKYLRAVRSDVDDILGNIEEHFVNRLDYDYENIKDDLRDNDLPYKKGELKELFEEIRKMTKEALDENISLNELLRLSLKAPGLLKDAENFLETEYCAEEAFYMVAQWQLGDPNASDKAVTNYSKELIEIARETVYAISDYSYIFLVVAALLILLLVLAVIAAITNVCNRGRWVKYILLAVIVVLIFSSCISQVLLTDILSEYCCDIPLLEDIALKITALPLFVVTLMAAQIVLDAFSECKRDTKNMENNYMDNNNLDATVSNLNELPEKERKERSINWRKVLPVAIGIGVGAILTGLTALGLVLLMMGNTYKTPIKIMERQHNSRKYVSAYNQSLEKLNGFAEKEFKEIVQIVRESEYIDDIEEEAEEYFEDRIDGMRDEYGRNYKITCSIDDKEKLDKDELRDFRNNIRDAADELDEMVDEIRDYDEYEEVADEFGISRSEARQMVRAWESLSEEFKDAEVTAGYRLEVIASINGSELDEPEEEELTVYVYKVNGRWISSGFLDGFSSLFAY